MLNVLVSISHLLYTCSLCIFFLQLVSSSRAYLRPLVSAVNSASPLAQVVPFVPSQSLLPLARSFQTSAVSKDIDSAAKFIGAGAATVGVAGSGMSN